MASPARKKKRGLESDDDMGDDPGLKASVEAYKNAGITVHYGLKAFVDEADGGLTEILRVYQGTYVADVDNLGKFITPLYLRNYTTIRDPGTGQITCIHDEKTKLEGPQLSRALALHSLKTTGYDMIIFNKKGESDQTSCFAMKKAWQLEEDLTTKRKSHHETVHRLYHSTGFTRVYAPRKLLSQVLSHNYVPLSKIRTIVSKLNTLVERQECNLDLSKLTKLSKILEAREDDQKRAETDFLEELVASCVVTASFKTKLNAFKKCPGPSLARRLGLVKPYQGKLIDRSTNREAERFTVGELQPDDMVLMSTISIDTKFYRSVTDDSTGWTVYKPSPNLGIIKDKTGWVALEGQNSIKAEQFVKLMTTIAEDNAGSKKQSDAEPANLAQLEKLSSEVDI